MPKLLLRPGADVPRFAILGAYEKATRIIKHVGLAAHATQVQANQTLPIVHIGPPLLDPQPVQVDVAGWSGTLSSDQEAGIEAWLQDLRTWHTGRPELGASRLEKLRDYIVLPPSSDHPDSAYAHLRTSDPESPGAAGAPRRYSCAGLVERCYAEGAGVDLVDHGALPALDLDAIVAIYPEVRFAHRWKLSAWIGLTPPGPWPILLPGYLLHAICRPGLMDPYRPKPEDREFLGSAEVPGDVEARGRG